jgi:hypothetical protein
MSESQTMPPRLSGAPTSLAPTRFAPHRPYPPTSITRRAPVDVDDLVERVSWLMLSMPEIEQQPTTSTTTEACSSRITKSR